MPSAITFPPDPTRLDYTVSPWTDTNGTEWLWEQTPKRWRPAAGGDSVAWSSVTGRPSEFNPSAHTHDLADIDDFPAPGADGNVLTSNGTEWVSEAPPAMPDISLMVESDITGISGADTITNMVSLTEAEYTAATKNATTLYIITA